MSVGHLLHAYGYLAVLLLVGGESLGLPLPGETMLIAAAVYAGTSHRLSVWVIFAMAALGAVVGDNIGFWIGEKGGYRLLRRYGGYARVDATKIKVGRLIFDRHGGKVVFFGRFVSILRTYAAFLAGTMRMRWRRFLAFNAAGGICWSAIYTFAPYRIGAAINQASRGLTIALGIGAAIVVVGSLVLIRRRAANLAVAAEAAFPGPLPER